MYTGEKYFWWNEAQRKLADEVAEFSDNFIAHRIPEIERTKRFPWEFMEEFGKKGWLGIFIPEEYGGMGKDYGANFSPASPSQNRFVDQTRPQYRPLPFWMGMNTS